MMVYGIFSLFFGFSFALSDELSFSEDYLTGRPARCFLSINRGEPSLVEVPEGARFSYALDQRLQVVARGPSEFVLKDLERHQGGGTLVEFRAFWDRSAFYEVIVGGFSSDGKSPVVLVNEGQAKAFGRALPLALSYGAKDGSSLEAICQ